MSSKPKQPPKIARKLREGQILHISFGPEGGRKYWLEPSNKGVTEGAARKAIAWPDVAPAPNGLFPDAPQSWTWRAA